MNDTTKRDGVYDPIPESCAEALRQWDAGETVFTVEMGGLGPGYEQAIQMLAFEIIRAILDFPFPPVGLNLSDAERQSLKTLCDETVHRCDIQPWGGFSVSQVGAAKNFACWVVRGGYRAALLDPAAAERLIQVSKVFPSELQKNC